MRTVIALASVAAVVAGAGAAHATFPGRNGKVACIEGQSLYTAWPDGSARQLVFGRRVVQAAWSSDGRRLAFTSTRDGDPEIYVIGADGRGLPRLTNNQVSDDSPTWSPDGTEVAFARSGRGVYGVYATSVDGRRTRRILRRRSWVGVPRWSPDGTLLAVTAHDSHSGLIPHVELLPLGGSARRCRTDTQLVGLAWLPDGGRFVARGYKSGLEAFVGSDCAAARYPERVFSVWAPDGTQALTDLAAVDWQPICTLEGTGRADRLTGTERDDVICGFAGADTIDGGGGHDVIYGGRRA